MGVRVMELGGGVRDRGSGVLKKIALLDCGRAGAM